ncbi:uncharacterized protein LOC134705517 [Mytilus trossulus]|uniref:uncharacterized protein LOC134705517 n=1 Tax=Mytilus trossulus TaxID=6551 RepID=UPI00300553BA
MKYQAEERPCYLMDEYPYFLSGRQGMIPSTDVHLESEVYSKDQNYVFKLTCYAFVKPFGEAASFLFDYIQVDAVRNVENTCFHANGKCLPEKCFCCTNEGLYVFLLVLKRSDITDLRSVSCEIRTDKPFMKSIASIDLDSKDFTATEAEPSIRKSNIKIKDLATPETKDQDRIKDKTSSKATYQNIQESKPDISEKTYIATNDLDTIKEIDEKDITDNEYSSHMSAFPSIFLVIGLFVALLGYQTCIRRSNNREISKICFRTKNKEQKDRKP